ncbi:unnamed protein product, partial [Mesorhabditis spiculigera]
MVEKFGIFLLFLATTVSTVPDCRHGACDALTCEAGWTALNRTRSCFKLIRNVDISKANAECGLYGATVASVGNAEENKDILEFGIISQVKKSEAYFLGAKKKGSGPLGFEWIDGKRFNYTNWKKGEPSDKHNGKSEECIEMFVRYWKFDPTKSLEQNMEATDAGKWNDLTCGWSPRVFACRKDQRPEIQGPSKYPPEEPSVITTVSKPKGPPCEAGWLWTNTTEKCYKFLSQSTLNQSIAQCGKMDASVAMIRSAAENQALIDLWQTNYNATVKCFLGARRFGKGKLDFRWLDGTNLTYNNIHQPYIGETEDCLELFIGDAFGIASIWNDVSCEAQEQVGVCEKKKLHSTS